MQKKNYKQNLKQKITQRLLIKTRIYNLKSTKRMILTLKADQIVPFLESSQKTDVKLRIYKQISTVSSEFLITIYEMKKRILSDEKIAFLLN